MRKDRAELVVGDLTDERGVEPERRRAGHAVRRRAAADLPARPHRRIEIARVVRCQELHTALRQAPLNEEGIVAGRDHIDDRIADRNNVEAGGIHRGLASRAR